MVAPAGEGSDLFKKGHVITVVQNSSPRQSAGVDGRELWFLKLSYVYAHSRYEIVYPAASAQRGQPSPPARAAQRVAAPQTDPHLGPCRLWQNYAGQ